MKEECAEVNTFQKSWQSALAGVFGLRAMPWSNSAVIPKRGGYRLVLNL